MSFGNFLYFFIFNGIFLTNPNSIFAMSKKIKKNRVRFGWKKDALIGFRKFVFKKCLTMHNEKFRIYVND